MRRSLFATKLFWRLVRKVRELGRPLWNIKIGGETLWKRMSDIAYRSFLASDSVQLPWGHTLYFPRGFHGRVEYHIGQYEPELTAYIMSVVREGMYVIDAGANIGYYTLLLSHLVGSTGTVYAFEPEPNLYQALVTNIERNALLNVRAYPDAVSDVSGEATLYADSHGVSSSLLADPKLNLLPIVVRTVRLDEVIPEAVSIGFAKIDVEGYEIACLRGMQRILSQSPSIHIALEMNLEVLSQNQLSPSEFLAQLEHFGIKHVRTVEYGLRFLLPQHLPHLLEAMQREQRKVVNLIATTQEGMP